MKKIFIFTILFLVTLIFIACEATVTTTSTTTQTTSTSTTSQTTTTFSVAYHFDDFSGLGTLLSPYEIDITENEEMSKTINFKILKENLVYTTGIIDNDVFLVEETNGIKIDDSNNFSLKIQALMIGSYYIMIKTENTDPIYVKVNVLEYQVDFKKSLKVLAIGNSFSVDGMEYLYQIAKNYGIPQIILGNLYIGGCSLRMHVATIEDNTSPYVYYKNTNNTWEYKSTNATILDGLLDEDWDIISIQQVSGYSGIPSSYNADLDTLIQYVNEHKTNDLAQIVWHMTWAYQTGSTHSSFPLYQNNQMTMYQAITSTVQEKILSRSDIEFVIPSGTAIQNLRTSYLGDTLTRDGFHLSVDYGRYCAGLTWFAQITNLPLDTITYIPAGVSANDLDLIKEAVINAIKNPYEVTQFVK